MYLRIRHATTYRYAVPVGFGPHRLMLRPRDSFDLRVVDTALSISPQAGLRWMHDAYGNSVAIADISGTSDTLDIVSELVIERFGSALPHSEAEVSAISQVAYSASERAARNHFLDYAAADPDGVLDVWLAGFQARSGDGSGHLLRDLAHGIYTGLTYALRYDEGTQHPADTLRLGSGSCRDYAWLFIELARRMGFAARFVTGYIHDRTPDAAGLVSAVGLTHAGGRVHSWRWLGRVRPDERSGGRSPASALPCRGCRRTPLRYRAASSALLTASSAWCRRDDRARRGAGVERSLTLLLQMADARGAQ